VMTRPSCAAMKMKTTMRDVATTLVAMLASVLALMSAPVGGQISGTTEVVIEGTISAADRLAWLERVFQVPPGTARIDVETDYSHRDEGTAIEFGIYDPVRFRGASRTSKTRFFIARTTATPSYHPGELPAGTWRLLMGVPSIRDGVTLKYRVRIRLTPEGPVQPTPFTVSSEATSTGPRWYHGDLHTHTLHSDGFGCADGRGGAGPCAPHQVIDAALRQGLDFLAVTDHNPTSHHADLAALQFKHDRLLLLRGQEMTTFYGHANVFGTSEVIDFRIGHAGRTARDAFAHARTLGALVSINHPGRETGERCTGCGWNAPDTDYALVDAIEVVNGFTVSGPTAGEPFWHARLNEGHRLTGIGGSDDHGASTRAGSAVGIPTTVIEADKLSEAALLAGIRAGRVYIKTRGPEGPDIHFSVPASQAAMGDVVKLPAHSGQVRFRLSIERGKDQRVDVIRNGQIVAGVLSQPIALNTATLEFDLQVSRGDWVRVSLRDAAGITVIANPVYFR
jgi:predicted metal-dependent phosphoesterase TrpH